MDCPLRLNCDRDAAATALESADAKRNFVRSDDFRQDFEIPMEAIRIEIARGNFATALAAADDATAHVGPRGPSDRGDAPAQPPIGFLSRAELQFLCGVVLTGLNSENNEGDLSFAPRSKLWKRQPTR